MDQVNICIICFKFGGVQALNAKKRKLFQGLCKFFKIQKPPLVDAVKLKGFEKMVPLGICEMCQELFEAFAVLCKDILFAETSLYAVIVDIREACSMSGSREDGRKVKNAAILDWRRLVVRKCHSRLQFANPQVKLTRLKRLPADFTKKSVLSPPEPVQREVNAVKLSKSTKKKAVSCYPKPFKPLPKMCLSLPEHIVGIGRELRHGILEPLYYCLVCETRFFSKMLKIHRKHPRVQCSSCSLTFMNEDYRDDHAAKEHK